MPPDFFAVGALPLPVAQTLGQTPTAGVVTAGGSPYSPVVRGRSSAARGIGIGGLAMRFGDFGQPRVQALLRDMLAKHRVGGSFLFVGPAGVGKEAVAVELGRLLNCTQPGGCEPRGLFAAPPRPADGEACASCRRFRSLQHPDLHVVFPAPIDFWEKAAPASDAALPDDFRQREPGAVAAVLHGKARDPYYKPMFERPAGIQAELLRDVVLPAVQRRPVEARTKVVLVAD